MPREPTTLLLGAGASCSYGFPVGNQLRKQILAIDPRGAQELLRYGPNVIRDFIKAFSRSQEDSIDAFLSRRGEEFGAVGKAAIAHLIIEAERNSNLFDEDNADNWCRYFLNELAPLGCDWNDFDPSWLSIVTFNYDRSLEYFLCVSLQHRYGKTVEEVLERLAKLKIVHVYGSLGDPWGGAADFLPYKVDRGGHEAYALAHWIHLAAARIKVIPEGRDDDASLTAAKEVLAKAKRVCILGFGFDATNMRRIGAPQVFDEGSGCKLVVATAFDLTEAEIGRAIKRVHGDRATGSMHQRFLNMTCRNLLRATLIFD